MQEIRILGVLVKNTGTQAKNVQQILTKYGCSIRTRLGLHEVEENCTDCGLILLELTGDIQESLRLENELSAVEGVQVQKMLFY